MDDNNKTSLFREHFIKGQIYKNVAEKKNVWQEIAGKLNGKFIVKQTVSKDVTTLVLEIPYKNYTVILTESDTKPLKSEVILELKDDLEFRLSWEDVFDRIMKFLGKQDIETGDHEFDKKYILQSNNPVKAAKIISQVKELILRLNIYVINLSKESSGVYKLLIIKDRNTSKIDEILDFIELNFRFIDGL